MLKQKMVFSLSLVAACVTFLISVVSRCRWEIVAFRSFISGFIFAIIGYFVMAFIVKWYKDHLNSNHKGSNVDITSDVKIDSLMERDQSTNESFIPLTPNNMKKVSVNK